MYIDNVLLGQSPLQRVRVEPGSHEISVHKPGYVNWQRIDNLVQGRETSASVVLLIPATLQITSDPAGATILIDGETVGTTPATLKDLIPGTRKVQLGGKLFEDWLNAVELKSGEKQSLHATLTLKKGSLKITANQPEAQITLDGKKVGFTPLALRNVEYGTHTILASKANFKTAEKRIELMERGPLEVKFNLEVAMATIRLSGGIQGASVRLDNKDAGALPVKPMEVLPGPHSLALQQKGHEKVKYALELGPNEVKKINVVFRRKTRGKAILKSLLFPGLGQGYSERRGQAVLFPVLELAAIGGALWATGQYNSSIDEYSSARAAYLSAFNDQEIASRRTAMNDAYNDVNSKEKLRNVFFGAAAGIWLWNIVDAALFAPKVESSPKIGAEHSSTTFYLLQTRDGVKLNMSMHF